jgi:NADH-quinone oxidoreductase subunit J
MLIQIYFWFLAAVLLGAALGVITSRNPVFSALFLVLAFVTSAVLWMLLEAEFLAIVLVLVYVGAVMVLFLFVVMMLDINLDVLKEGFVRFAPVGAVVALVMIGELATIFFIRNAGLPILENPPPHPADYSNTEALGAVLYTEHVYAFELASFILLLAIVAAIVLTMRKRPGLKQQDIARQVAVRREDRVRLVSMAAEKEDE